MSNVVVAPCPHCGAVLKKKITVRGETVYDHPTNGCQLEWKRVRSYAVKDWNIQATGGKGEHNG